MSAFRRMQSVGLNTGVSLDPEQELQQDNSEPDTQPESDQGTPQPMNSPPPQALIEIRIQQLQNRRFLLLKMLHIRKKAEDNSRRTTEEMTSEDSNKLCELEAIQKELEELLAKQEKSSNTGDNTASCEQDTCPTFYNTETPCGGIYMLPPPQLTQEDITLEQTVKTTPAAEKPTGPVVAVDSLGQTPAVTQCPSCQEVIFTETHSRVGETMWMLCCLFSMTGCIAGCCVIPFFMDRLKNVQHLCPQCQAHIHTYQPF
ncbi:uncharacterized protein LOC122867136 isoform X2 [Siniperca chuatsi]|uniref:uncharacterized protein LOC122867136 isoform X2 n=1 Tax=Siniperca chuatsi TaxID=119488 RepID=UPI001CE1B983|nr:uncharacterized protein LOC122867136 isoform X2 [Siniperca chuatsi]XP_044033426.1 uncharacterized protein LOC122867136 isoform X2 [Siniperca chuatsi]